MRTNLVVHLTEIVAKKVIMYTEIENEVKNFNPANITTERRAILQPLVDYIQNKVTDQQEIRLNLICTHNSRRSQPDNPKTKVQNL